MKNQSFLILSLLTILFSCRENKNAELIPISENIHSEPLILNQIDSTNNFSKEEFIDSQIEYSDSLGNSLLILNSYPKGGQKYTDPQGNDYVYAVFWTQIINKTNRSVDIKINFPLEDQELPNSPEIRYKLILPPTKMTDDKIQQMNYGLSNMDFILDRSLSQETQLDKSILPNETEMFYVIVLTSQGLEGTIRAGFNLKGEELIYRIHQSELNVGEIQY